MRQRLKKLQNSLLFFLELQLLISVVILPILIAWGLAISIMSIFGNLIFAQFLTVFILVSTILFTCDFFGIPNSYVVICLERVTNIWHYFLSFGSVHWLVGYPELLFPLSALAALAACGMYIKKIKNQHHRILILMFLCAITPIAKTFLDSSYQHTTILQGNQKFHIIKKNGAIYAFDCGALGARPSSQSWIEYTLTPHMIKTMGATHIDMLVLCKSNSRTKSAAQALMENIPVTRLISITKNNQPMIAQKEIISPTNSLL